MHEAITLVLQDQCVILNKQGNVSFRKEGGGITVVASGKSR
jgi:hypothetical protein